MLKKSFLLLITVTLTLQLTACATGEPVSPAEREEPVALSPSNETVHVESVRQAALSNTANTTANTATATATTTAAPTYASTAKSLVASEFDLYIFRSGFTVSRLSADKNAAFAAVINRCGLSPIEDPDPFAASEADFLVLVGDQKFTYSLYPLELSINGDSHAVSAADAATLRGLYSGEYHGSYTQWLVYMTTSRISGVRYSTQSSGGVKKMAATSDWKGLVDELRQLQIQDGASSIEVGRSITPAGNNFTLYLDFDGGNGAEGDLFYTLIFDKGNLYIESSDLGYSCSYKLAGSTMDHFFRQFAERGVNPRGAATARP